MADTGSPVRGRPGAAGGPSGDGAPTGYRVLLADPRARRMVVASLLSKFPISMITISVLLLAYRHHSYATAGVTLSCMLIAGAITAPVRGRMVDRHSPRTMLPIMLAAYLAALAGLAWTATTGAPAPLMLGFAALVGAVLPPVNILMRTLWRLVATEDTLVSAISLESMLMDLTLVTGPALATWLSLSVAPAMPLLVCALSIGVATFLVRGLSGALPVVARPKGGHWFGPLRSAPLRRVFIAYFVFCTGLNAIEVALPLYARHHDATGYTGIYLGTIAVGSILGALALGALPRALPARRRLPLLLTAYAVGTALLALAAGLSPVVLLIVCPVAGLAIGSTFAAIMMASGSLAPRGFENETQGWNSSLLQVGAAAGATASSSLAAAHGSLTVLSLVPVVIALAAATVWSVGVGPARD
ncbi:MFS transporter [Streptomyces javensis]|uniref:MFS transporter n=1 Tax=Streptomyces javensis TaxID=114698 RepID=UPI0033EA6E2D